MNEKVTRRADYTFRYNGRLGRHGWLRLTPAYSVKLVEKIMDDVPEDSFILDPFSGTATTGLVAAERGLSAHGFDVNPFLVWFGNAKCRNYSKTELARLQSAIDEALAACKTLVGQDHWVPNIHDITRWWRPRTLSNLAALRRALVERFGEPATGAGASDLAWIAFCRLIIETSAAAFNHVSMSFRAEATTFDAGQIESLYAKIAAAIARGAGVQLRRTVSIHFADAREPARVGDARYSHVVTSPPYPNRVSYIRELRPYMYWTKFLDTAREAGEMDWRAIGGTWGVATSRLHGWVPDDPALPASLGRVVSRILNTKQKNSSLMANYVRKYFHDVHSHLRCLQKSLKKGAVLSYIVGNSSFYGVQVRTDELLMESLRMLGFANASSTVIRKRNSKKELFEYCVRATWKADGKYEPKRFDARREAPETLALL